MTTATQNCNSALALASVMMMPLHNFVWRESLTPFGSLALNITTAASIGLSIGFLRDTKWWYFLAMYFYFLWCIRVAVDVANDYDGYKLFVAQNVWPFTLYQEPTDHLIRAYLVLTSFVSIAQAPLLSLPFSTARRFFNVAYLCYALMLTALVGQDVIQHGESFLIACFVYRLVDGIDDRQTPMYLLALE